MKWHKKFCDHLDDPFIQELLFEFGAQGYLVYYGVIAYIGRESEYGNVTGKGIVNARILKQKTHVSLTKIKLILDFCQRKVELSYSFDGENFKFCIPKLLKWLDNYEKNLQAASKPLASKKEDVDVEVEVEVDKPFSEGKNFNEEDYNTAVLMFEKIKSILPNLKEPNYNVWSYDINLIVRIDGKSHDDIIRFFTWASEDSFWCANILSPEKLRKQWDQLEAKMARGKNKVEPELESDPDNGTEFYKNIAAEEDAKEARLAEKTPENK